MLPSGAITNVCGIALLPFESVFAVSRSAHPNRNPKLTLRTNSFTRPDDVRGSSVVRPINSTLRSAYSLRTLSYSGTSQRHGPHQDAHRFTTTTLSLQSANR